MTTPSNNPAHTEEEQPLAVYVQGLSFRYRSIDDEPEPSRKDVEISNQPQTIEDISFSLPGGELMLIAGPSGCGKSTLLKCLNGLIPRSYPGTLSGEIRLEGQAIARLSLRDLARQVGTMLQDPDKQILGSTVEQEIAFGMENLNRPRTEMRQRVQDVLKRLHLESYQGNATFALSGGQRQQVAAAGILVMEPTIFLFDEPFANLDSRAIDELETLIAELREEGHTVVIVEHRVEEALRLKPDKVLVMQDGHKTYFGEVQGFLAMADPAQVKLPIEATLRTIDDPSQARNILVRPIVTGESRRDVANKGNDAASILTFEQVHYRYNVFSEEILHGVSFQVQHGETIALLGP